MIAALIASSAKTEQWTFTGGSANSSYEYRPAPFRLSPRAYDPDPMMRPDPFHPNPYAPNRNANPNGPYSQPGFGRFRGEW